MLALIYTSLKGYLIDTDMQTPKTFVCYLNNSESESMLLLDLTYSLLAGWLALRMRVVEEEQRLGLRGGPPVLCLLCFELIRTKKTLGIGAVTAFQNEVVK